MLNLHSAIESNYGITVDSLCRIPFGYTNKNFNMTSGAENYICRVSPANKMSHLRMESEVLDNLGPKNLGFAVPKKIKAKSGKDFAPLEGEKGIITLFEYIPGYNATDNVSYAQKEEFHNDFAKCVGKLHSALSTVKIGQNEHTHKNLIQSYKDKFRQYAAIPASLEWQQLLNREIPILMNETEKYQDYFREISNPEIVHTDLRLENIMAKDSKVSGIVDFDDVLFGRQAYDLSKIMIEVFGYKDSHSSKLAQLINLDGFGEFVRVYNKNRRITTSQTLVKEVADLATLPSVHVLSLVGRDPDFDDSERTKNVAWYSNAVRVMKNKENLQTIRSKLKQIK